MVWSRSWLLPALLSGCITLNPAFKDDGGTDDGDATAGVTDASESTSRASGADASTTTTAEGSGESAAADPSTTETTADASPTGTIDIGETTGPPCLMDPQDPTCTTLSIDGHSYLRCEEDVPWKEAVAGCAARCATLAMFTESLPPKNKESEDITVQLRMLMSDADMMEEMQIDMGDIQQADSKQASWWIGGHRQDDAKWYWLNGAAMPEVGKGGWAPQSPESNPVTDQSCTALAVFGAQSNNNKWFDRDCTNQYRYICEIP